MDIVVLDAAGLGADIDLAPLEALGELQVWQETAEQEVASRVADARVIVTNKMRLNRENLACAQHLELICVTATGYDAIDTAYCAERGIALCNVPGYSTDSVAQLTLAMVLSLSTRLVDYREFVHSGEYSRGGSANRLTPLWHELAGKTWGVAGCGAIGRRVARIAECLGCRVLVFRREKDPDYETVDLDTLCAQSDILTVHLPLSADTRGILTRERIAALRPGAIVVNVARGAVADEAALAEAVEQGRLGGLGVDVFSREPFPQEHAYSRILHMPNVIMTPHVGWGAVESRNRCIREVAENIRAFRCGSRRNRIV